LRLKILKNLRTAGLNLKFAGSYKSKKETCTTFGILIFSKKFDKLLLLRIIFYNNDKDKDK